MVLAAAISAHDPAMAEPMSIPSTRIALEIDSGPIGNAPVAISRSPVVTPATVAFARVVRVDAAWIQLDLTGTKISGSPADGTASFVRLTSLHDGASQTLDQAALRQWGYRSAYFNGGDVLLELLATARSGANRLRVSAAVIGETAPPRDESRHASDGRLQETDDGIATIDGTTSGACPDERVPSNDPRVGRLMPVGCTAFLIDDALHNFLTAGHCVDEPAEAAVVEFNVPASLPDGTVQHPPPQDQYPLDHASVQFQTGGTGSDWGYFAVHRNALTDVGAFDAQGAAFSLADVAPEPDGRDVRVTGFGTDADPPGSNSGPNSDNQIQQTDTGLYASLGGGLGTRIEYQVSEAGGNSGSPVVDEISGDVIGIHGYGGCPVAGGTAIHHPCLQKALSEPKGLAADCNGNGLADPCDVDCGASGGECDLFGCGLSADCSGNGVPDECEPDCDENGIADSCDLLAARRFDDNQNGVPDRCETLFVRADAPPNGDGSSWFTAYRSLDDALGVARGADGGITMIWVAAGVYRPTGAGDPRDASFALIDGVALYGGFAGVERRLVDRDVAVNQTILSGDLLGNDGTDFSGREENSFHVVTVPAEPSNDVCCGPCPKPTLDGFTVTGGNADGPCCEHDRGGGLKLFRDAQIANCRVVGNRAIAGGGAWVDSDVDALGGVTFLNNAAVRGGAVYIDSGRSVVLRQVRLLGNRADEGGAIYADQSTLTVVNGILSGNVAQEGGAIYHATSGADGVSLVHATVCGNHAEIGIAGGIYLSPSSIAVIDNSILWGNQGQGASASEAQIHGGLAIVRHGTVQGGWSGPGVAISAADPQLVDANGPDDVAGTEDDDLRLTPWSPVVDAGDNTLAGPTSGIDLNARSRPLDGDGDGESIVDQGAFERLESPRPAAQLCPSGNECLAPALCSAGACTCADDSDCENEARCLAGVCCVSRMRYLSIQPGNSGVRTALRVTFHGTDGAGDSQTAQPMWVGPPETICAKASTRDASNGCHESGTVRVARVQCEPYYQDWSVDDSTSASGEAGSNLHVYGSLIAPGGAYTIDAVAFGDDISDPFALSSPLLLPTAGFGDVAGAFDDARSLWAPPDGLCDIATDVPAILDKFSETIGAPGKVLADVAAIVPDGVVDIRDVAFVLDACLGSPMPVPVDECP